MGVSAFAYAGIETVSFQGVNPPQISNKAHAPAKGSFGVSGVLITFNCGLYGDGAMHSEYEGYDALSLSSGRSVVVGYIT